MRVQRNDKSIKWLVILRVVTLICIIVTSISCYTRVQGWTDEEYDKLKESRKEIKDKAELVENSEFRGKEVHIATSIRTLECLYVSEYDGNRTVVDTRYGRLSVYEPYDKECITVYADINGKLDYIGNIGKNKYIDYVIYGYNRINEDTIIINSNSNRKKYSQYAEYMAEIDNFNENYQKTLQEIEEHDKIRKGIVIIIAVINIIILLGTGDNRDGSSIRVRFARKKVLRELKRKQDNS